MEQKRIEDTRAMCLTWLGMNENIRRNDDDFTKNNMERMLKLVNAVEQLKTENAELREKVERSVADKTYHLIKQYAAQNIELQDRIDKAQAALEGGGGE